MLDQADRFIADGHYPAAANYARAACELVMRRLCAERKVPVSFHPEGEPSFEALYQAAVKWAKEEPAKRPRTIAALDALTAHRNFVFNPLSHRHDKDVPKSEVVAAIAAVRALAKVSKKEPPATAAGSA